MNGILNTGYLTSYSSSNISSNWEDYLKYNTQGVLCTYSTPVFSEPDNSNDNIRLLHKTNLLKIKHL